MIALLFLMLLRSGLIILLAYLLMNSTKVRDLLAHRKSVRTQAILVFIFGVFAVISNFTGVEIDENRVIVEQLFSQLGPGSSLANTRVLTIGVSGLIGGPLVGTAVGVLSAIIRYFQGGVDVHIYVISSISIGLLSGVYGARSSKKNRFPSSKEGFLVGIAMEIVQMLMILIFSSDFASARELVMFIAIPMIGANSIGTAIFLSIIETTLKQEEMAKAVQTHDVLQLTNETLPYFSSGLNQQSATAVAQIIKRFIKVSAVSLTDKNQILAHVGAGSDHHKPTREIVTGLSKQVLAEGEIKEARSKREIDCDNPNCPLAAAIVIPLKSKNQVIGTLKLYFTDENELTYVERQLAEGLGSIFSTQIELGERENETKLLKQAEIDSLQAQVNPHFLFNAMNTISSLIRIDSEKARKLVLELSHFLRANLQGARLSQIPLEQELAQLHSYLELEFARFPDRYTVTFAIQPNLQNALVPPFILQNLVENAIRHAFKNRQTGNHVHVSIQKETANLHVQITDNGHGINKAVLSKLGKEPVQSNHGSGTALDNLNKRLINLYGPVAALQFTTSDTGTTITSRIPLQTKEESHAYPDC
ncbi:LytS/YhcK type 5TM receptor domain-containing protein [Jeotgalibaca sp. A122]|uniref:LytS/YhcK type 5TM receptor domain-containing protein n=1 Tax=Jeotgalibaca sp. A122 TaxID=3457322 RepID=UPI003FD63289